ncbi:DUF4383 domain-containing protein [Candidatus Wolfebacteria bacterium]|nr:DUF4383 domain-containing protein [Candidatus Wolfebacteria bacterium]
MLKTWAWIFAAVFILIGILGFVPGITTAEGNLLGVFEVDTMHNIAHMVTGLVALFVALGSERARRLFFQIFGWLYLLTTIIGFIQGDTVLGIIGANMADHFLHLVIAIVSLWLGYGGRKRMAGSVPTQPQQPPQQPQM